MAETTVNMRDRLAKMAIDGLVATAVTIGYKLDLFKALAEISSPENPTTPKLVAEKAHCKERYVAEWLAVMATGNIIEVSPEEKFWIKPENVHDLTVDNQGLSQCMYLPCFLKPYENLLEVFRENGPPGLKYSDYNDFYDVMNRESKVFHKEHFIKDFLPSVSPSLPDELTKGCKMVLDVGCGSGFHSALLAEAFPASNFTGIDVTLEAILAANQQRVDEGLTFENLAFIKMDGGDMDADWTEKYDLVLIVDACHDQMRPDKCLKEIHRVLKPDGIFAMLEIKGTSNIYEDKKKYGDIATSILCSSMFHCLPVGSNSEDALCLGAMWGSKRAIKLLNECGFTNVLAMNKTLLLLLVVGISAVLADNNYGITCQFCKVQLASMTETIQGNPDMMSQMGDSASQGCDQIPNKDMRKACRETLDDNFPLFLQKFLEEPDTSAADFCKQMGYCF
ncbi:unnamed protein product [Auanema sp. JU1783]|nr:unnamed protein product [Auanema sp. JU1783]